MTTEAVAAAVARAPAPPPLFATSSVASGASSSSSAGVSPAPRESATEETPRTAVPTAVPRRTALKRKREPTSAYEHSSQWPCTALFSSAVQQERVEEAHRQTLLQAPLPRVLNPQQVYDDMRTQYFKEYFARKRERAQYDQDSVREMRAKARLVFSKLTVSERVSLARRASQEPGVEKERALDLENKALCLQAQQEVRDAGSAKFFVHAKGMINTYQSTKHLLFEMPEGVASVDDAVAYLMKKPELVALFNRFCAHVSGVAQSKLQATQWSASAELCTETFVERHVLRVHLHAGYHRSGSEWKWSTAKAAGLEFEGMLPHNNTAKIVPGVSFGGKQCSSFRKKNTRADANFMAIHYYIQCENKVGTLLRQGSKQPFTGYGVKGAWITSWTQVALHWKLVKK